MRLMLLWMMKLGLREEIWFDQSHRINLSVVEYFCLSQHSTISLSSVNRRTIFLLSIPHYRILVGLSLIQPGFSLTLPSSVGESPEWIVRMDTVIGLGVTMWSLQDQRPGQWIWMLGEKWSFCFHDSVWVIYI